MRPSLAMMVAATSLSFDSVFAKKCNSNGVQWALFNNTATAGNSVPGYPAFDPSAYQTAKPVYQSTSTLVGGDFSDNPTDSPETISIYNSPKIFSADAFVLNHQGYIHAKDAGTYIFNVAQTDGQSAYTGYTRNNAACVAVYNRDTEVPGACQVKMNLTKGQFMPFRIMYGQGYYSASSTITLTSPSGKTLFGGSTSSSKYVVQYACGKNAKKAPKFAAFGNQA